MKAKIKRFVQRVKKVIKRPDMVLLPGQLAFFLVLAIVPTMTLITYGASKLNLSMDFLYDFLATGFSTEIADLMLSTSSLSNAGFKLTIVLIISYYLSSNGASSMIITSNTIYGIKNGSFFQRRFKAIVMSILMILLVLFLLLVPIFGDTIVGLIEMVNLNTGITSKIVQVFSYLQSPIMWLFIFFLLKMIYVMAPDRKIKAHNANYGAVFTTVCWIVITYFYSIYIKFATYSAFYGGLANICVLMVWFYLLAYFLVIGMALNYQRESEQLEKNGIIKTKE